MHRERRKNLPQTNHMHPDRRRCFYLAIDWSGVSSPLASLLIVRNTAIGHEESRRRSWQPVPGNGTNEQAVRARDQRRDIIG